jgi:uncharacterized protein YjbJ (UPF0337 family)
MNSDIFKGQWKQIKGTVKSKWSKLTEDDLLKVEGRRDQLVGAIQERYGIAKDDAERQLTDLEKDLSPTNPNRQKSKAA